MTVSNLRLRANRLPVMRGPYPRLDVAGIIGTAAVALATFGIAYKGGGYSLQMRTGLAIVLWWAIGLAAAAGVLPLRRFPRTALVAGAGLAGLMFWTGLSTQWSVSAEAAFIEFDRVALYLGVFVVVVSAATRSSLARWCNGFALGITGIALLALLSRFFPDGFPSGQTLRGLFSGVGTRLTYPVDYWNGLAILVALAVPLLLRVTISSPSTLRRGAAIAPIPVIGVVIYLASSRGGTAIALIAAITFLMLTARRWSAAVAVSVAALGTYVAVALVRDRDALVNGPLDSHAAVTQGRSAALLVFVVSLGSAALYGGLVRAFAGRLIIPRSVGRVAAGVVLCAGIAVLVSVHPRQRFQAFKQYPVITGTTSGTLEDHFFSSSGGGRWQMWHSAVDEFRANPVKGGGAGSFGTWWRQHGSLPLPIQDAHSLYAETLGELGIVGFCVVVGTFGLGFLAFGQRWARSCGDDQMFLAALGSTFLAYTAAAAIDWVWEIPAVTAVGIALLALLTAPGTVAIGADTHSDRRVRGPAWLRVGVLAASLALIVGQAIPLLVDVELRRSRDLAGQDLSSAFTAALRARDIQPWAASPYLQLALLAEEANDLRAAQHFVEQAIDRDSRDWRLWLVASRLETKTGSITAAERSLARAVQLNPRSPLFTGLSLGSP